MKKRDTEGLGIKYTKLSLNFLGANCRSINTKQANVSEILEMRVVDIGFFRNSTQKNPLNLRDLRLFAKLQCWGLRS